MSAIVPTLVRLPSPKSLEGSPGPVGVTLLDLVRCVAEVTEDDREVVATVAHMLRTGLVRLCGNFRDGRFDDFTP